MGRPASKVEIEDGFRDPLLNIDKIQKLSALPAVKTRRRRSWVISFMSMVPAGWAGSPTTIVWVVARRARPQTRTLPRRSRGPEERREMLHHDVAVQCDTEAHSATLGARSDFSCRREQGASVQGATDHSVTRYRLEATPQREFIA